jgi:hypothetical protein
MQAYRESDLLSLDIALEHGSRGTVPMLKAALKVSLDLLEKEGMVLTRVELMDASNNDKVNLSDFYLLTHADTWYGTHMGATITPEFSSLLKTNRELLGQPVNASDRQLFFDKCLVFNDENLLWSRYVRDIEDFHPVATKAFDVAAGRSWRDLFTVLSESRNCVMFAVLMPNLGSVLPGWKSTYGWRWLIDKNTVTSYSVVFNITELDGPPPEMMRGGGKVIGHVSSGRKKGPSPAKRNPKIHKKKMLTIPE